MAKADNVDANKRLPVCDEPSMLAVVTLKGPELRITRGLISHT